ncbi:hypothetical protein ACG7TL_002242 [Trametes sanguinea]
MSSGSSSSSSSNPINIVDPEPQVDHPDGQERPAKRRREDAGQELPAESEDLSQMMPTITRSPGLWFDDGNIVLIADKRVAFRIHLGVLARHSSIFSDAFGLPQPGSAECYDGCPVLHISDQAADTDFLLQALYDGIRFKPIGLRAQAAFTPHAALLSLSHKYDIEHLREEAHLRIKSCFPYQFSEFRSSVRFPVVPGAGCVLRSSTLEVQASRDAIRAVNIARLIDDRRMLPMALYLCVQLPVTTLLAGIARSDPDSHCRDTLSHEDLKDRTDVENSHFDFLPQSAPMWGHLVSKMVMRSDGK